MQKGSTKKISQRTLSSRRCSKSDEKTKGFSPVKRTIEQDKASNERSVRFRSIDEEYVFEEEPLDFSILPTGSDIFQRILTDIHLKEEECLDSEDYEDDVFGGVFTAKATTKTTTTTTSKAIKKTVSKKIDLPKKSILKRRKSSRDKRSSVTKL